jgi:RNA polymerase sigma-70 factor (ECF subfamily)
MATRAVLGIVKPAEARAHEAPPGLVDGPAFAALVRQEQRAVFFLCLRMLRGDEAMARDLTQKTFLQAWTHRDGFRGEASARTWLLRIAANLSKNELRMAWRRRESAAVPDEDGELPEPGIEEASAFSALERREARALLCEAVDALPARQRQVMVLRVFSGLEFAEVGESCGITANNAKVNFHHAVRNVRRFLAARGVPG